MSGLYLTRYMRAMFVVFFYVKIVFWNVYSSMTIEKGGKPVT